MALGEAIHESSKLKFCSECGGLIALRWQVEDRRERLVCESCGTVHYRNPRVLVICAVVWSERLLMCRRACDPGLGKWIGPSGYLECGETLQEGAARETFEETGVIVDPAEMELQSVINLVGLEQVAVTFRVELDAQPVIRPGPECAEAAFLSQDELRQIDVAWHDASGKWAHSFFDQRLNNRFAIQLVNIACRPGEIYSSRDYTILEPERRQLKIK
jgi:ADP-ribose pyrophosphatase YjhB (NUDIX family)